MISSTLKASSLSLYLDFLCTSDLSMCHMTRQTNPPWFGWPVMSDEWHKRKSRRSSLSNNLQTLLSLLSFASQYFSIQYIRTSSTQIFLSARGMLCRAITKDMWNYSCVHSNFQRIAVVKSAVKKFRLACWKQFDIYLDWIGSDMLSENKTCGYDSCFIFASFQVKKKVLTSAIRILNEANTCKYQKASRTVGPYAIWWLQTQHLRRIVWKFRNKAGYNVWFFLNRDCLV